MAVFHKPDHGGNDDGWITADDAIYTELRVWIDSNQDGISQPNELKTLKEVGIKAISLKYSLLRRTDQNGNVFRFRGTLRDVNDSEVTKVIYDVFVGAESSSPR